MNKTTTIAPGGIHRSKAGSKTSAIMSPETVLPET